MSLKENLSRATAVLLITAAGCTSDTTKTPTAVDCGNKEGTKDTWSVGEEVTARIGNTTIFLTVDGVGPKGAFIRGISNILGPNDEIVRTAEGRNFDLGCIAKLHPESQSVDVVIYPQALEVSR